MPAKDAPLVLLVCGYAEDADRLRRHLDTASPAIVVDGSSGRDVGDWARSAGAMWIRNYGAPGSLRLAMLIADRWDHDEMRVGVLALPGAGEICGLAEDAGVTVWRPEGE